MIVISRHVIDITIHQSPSIPTNIYQGYHYHSQYQCLHDHHYPSIIHHIINRPPCINIHQYLDIIHHQSPSRFMIPSFLGSKLPHPLILRSRSGQGRGVGADQLDPEETLGQRSRRNMGIQKIMIKGMQRI